MDDLQNSSGIYKILNKINGKFYIGSAIDIKVRWYQHRWYLNNGKHHNLYLQRAWNLNSNDFDFIILEICENIREREQHWINILNPEYNLTKTVGSLLGYKHSEETKRLMSERRKGNQFNKGKHHSEETKKKISEGNKGKLISFETRAKQSASGKGRKFSPEGCANIAAASKRRKHSEKTKVKMSEIAKARWQKQYATKF